MVLAGSRKDKLRCCRHVVDCGGVLGLKVEEHVAESCVSVGGGRLVALALPQCSMQDVQLKGHHVALVRCARYQKKSVLCLRVIDTSGELESLLMISHPPDRAATPIINRCAMKESADHPTHRQHPSLGDMCCGILSHSIAAEFRPGPCRKIRREGKNRLPHDLC